MLFYNSVRYSAVVISNEMIPNTECIRIGSTVELCYSVTKGTEYLSLYTSVFLTKEYTVTVNSEELFGTTE
jgi:hypothetical protein